MKPVFVFAVGFWLIGSLVCYSFAALDAFVKADAATIAPPLRASAPYLRFVCLGLGLILGLFNAFLPRVGFVALARRDCARIHALGDAARWHHFFRKIGLVVVMLVAMTCAIAEKQTEAYWVSVLTFTVLLACVGTGLFCGAITVARESRRAPLLAPAEAATAPLADGLLSAAPPLGVR